METYTFLRQLADSWVLLALTVFFLGIIVWAFRPGSRETHRETADIPFRNDTNRAVENAQDAPENTASTSDPETRS